MTTGFRLREGSEGAMVTVNLEGQPLQVAAEVSVAAALLAAGVATFRSTPVSGSPRGPFCMMGVCFDCLLEIDGMANRQSCLTPVREGMCIRMQHGARPLPRDEVQP